MSKAKPQTLVNRARAERDRLADRAAEWHAQAATREAEADSLEARLGDDVLAAGDDGPKVADDLSAKLTELRTSADVARRTAEAADRKVPEQERDMVRAAAAGLAEQARKARTEADGHQAKADRLRGQLEELEGGATFVPWKPDRDRVSPGESVTYTRPRSEVLTETAARLERRATEVERLADADDLTTATVEQVVAEAFPDSAEAQAIADRKAQAERERAEAKDRADLHEALSRERKAKLREVAVEFTGHLARERFVELYADKIARRDRLDADQACTRAEQAADEADRRARGQTVEAAATS